MSHDFSTRPHLSVAFWTQSTSEAEDKPLPAERYRTDLELGRGGMGVVRAVTDLWLNRQVAMKHPRDDAHIAKVLREAAITARLNHPSIPPIFDVGSSEDGPFYTMPVLEGLPYDSAQLSRVERVHRLRMVAEALSHAHKRGIVHRDIKPANVLCGEAGEVWVVDWGVAWDHLDPDEGRVGTPGYASPEQLLGRCSPQSDVYGLGCMLRGASDGDPMLDAIAEKACSNNPNDRYETALALARELARWAEGHRIEAHSYSGGELVRLYVRRYRWQVLAIALVAATLGAVVIGSGLALMQEQRATSSALAATLAWQASELAKQGDRAESELLAALAQEHSHHPRARGVWLRWSGSPPPVRTLPYTPACSDVMLQHDGNGYCPSTGDVLDIDGAVIGPITLPDLPPGRIHLLDEAVVLTTIDTIEWHPHTGEPTTWPNLSLPMWPKWGAWPSFFQSERVFQITPTGPRSWESRCPPTARRRAIVGDHNGVAVGCPGEAPNVEWFTEDQRHTLDPGGEVSALALTSQGLAAARWDKKVGHWDGTEWTMWDVPEIAAGLETFRGTYVLVRLENGPARLLDTVTGQWVYSFPAGSDALYAIGDRVRWQRGSKVVDYELPPELRAAHLDAASHGGTESLALSPDGARLATGHGSSATLVWDLEHDRVEEIGERGDNIVKALAYDSSGHLWIGNDQSGSTKSYSHQIIRRHFEPFLDGVVAIDFGGRLRWINRKGTLSTDATLTGVDHAGDELWMLGDQGLLRLVEESQQPVNPDLSSGWVAATPTAVFVTQDSTNLWGLNLDGDVVWKRQGVLPITVIAAEGDWVVAGYRDGSVRVFSSEHGTLVAELDLHQRKVAEVLISGTTLFTAGWDGFVYRMDLDVLKRTPPTPEDVERRWGLSLEDVRATPWSQP